MSVNPSRQVPPPQHRRYEDSLYAVMSKQTRPQQNHQPVIDSYHALRSATAAGPSGVFDPSEFPSLGGAPVPIQPSVLGSSSSVDPGVMAMQSANFPNGMSTYQDLYGVAYADGRGKAVEAVTGANPPVEFSMTNEDFPALGGGAAALRGASSLMSAPNGNPVAQSVRLTGDGYETAQMKNVQSQLHAVLGRGNLRVDQTNGGLIASGAPPNDFQVADAILGGSSAANFLRVSAQKHAIPESSRRSPTRGYRSSSPPPSVAARTNIAPDVSRASADDIVSPIKKNPIDVDPRIPNGKGEVPSINGSLNANGTTLNHAPAGSSDGNSRSSSHDEERTNTSNQTSSERRPFDMLGLLKYVNPEAEGTNRQTLSIGYDLTLMGLDLNSMEPLHRTFGNPWDSALNGPFLANGGGFQLRNDEPEFKLPTCYYMQPPQLKNSHFAKFTAETLFYVFYNMPKDVLQMCAAIELYHRKWFYHKDLKLWFHQVDNSDKFDHNSYTYFDIKSWEKRPFADATKQFIQGLMTEEELKKFPMPGGARNAS